MMRAEQADPGRPNTWTRAIGPSRASTSDTRWRPLLTGAHRLTGVLRSRKALVGDRDRGKERTGRTRHPGAFWTRSKGEITMQISPVMIASDMILNETGNILWKAYQLATRYVGRDEARELFAAMARNSVDQGLPGQRLGAPVARIIIAFWDHDSKELKKALLDARAWKSGDDVAANASAMLDHVLECSRADKLASDPDLVEQIKGIKRLPQGELN